MSFISALDNYTIPITKQIGENGSAEYSYSDNFKERVTQFYFQLVRVPDTKNRHNKNMIQTSNEGDSTRHNNLKEILDSLLTHYKNLSIEEQKKGIDVMCMLFQIIAQTRDIVSGKGECMLTYMQILKWYDYYPELAKFALHRCVYFDESMTTTVHPYGSWKDIKYFCDYVVRHNELNVVKTQHPLIEYAINLMVVQIKMDNAIYKSVMQKKTAPSNNVDTTEENLSISLAAKWCPREKSNRFGWLFSRIADTYFDYYLATAMERYSFDIEQRKSMPYKIRPARRKAKMDMRKLLTKLNKYLDTTQVKQCCNEWKNIDFSNVTGITLRKQVRAFQNVNKTYAVRHPENSDRISCAENYSAHIKAALAGDTRYKIHGKRLGVGELVKDAFSVTMNNNSIDSDMAKKLEEKRAQINMQWEDNGKTTGNLGNMIAMVDTSGSMECDNGIPINNAIGIGLRIAEKSKLGKRIMTFSATPDWVNFDDCLDFCDCVNKTRQSNWGMNTNFDAAMKLVLEACNRNKVPQKDVENLIFVVLSDMQIDYAVSNNSYGIISDGETMNRDGSLKHNTMIERIEVMFKKHGYRSMPHIVFFNLRSTHGFPVLSTMKNTSMVSGYSVSVLNNFIEKGVDGLKEITPWKMLGDILNKERYHSMGCELHSYMTDKWINETTKNIDDTNSSSGSDNSIFNTHHHT